MNNKYSKKTKNKEHTMPTQSAIVNGITYTVTTHTTADITNIHTSKHRHHATITYGRTKHAVTTGKPDRYSWYTTHEQHITAFTRKGLNRKLNRIRKNHPHSKPANS